MDVQLYTVIKCISCSAHRKEVVKVCDQYGLTLKIYDIDDEKYLYQCLSAMKMYGVTKTPSIILTNDSGNRYTIQGIRDSIRKLKEKIDEERSND